MRVWWWASLWVATPAWATSGLAWRWAEGEERRYQVSTALDLPFVVEFNAINNTDAQVTGFNLGMVLRCRMEEAIGKTGFALRCEIDAASVQVEPVPSSVRLVQPIAEEWAGVLERDAWIQVELTQAGRVRSVDLEGVDKRIQRTQQIGETMRLMVARALAPLDVGLPRKGDDGGLGQWVQPMTMINGLPRVDGSVGTMPLVHSLLRTDGTRVFWAFHGDGSLASADDANSTARFSYAMRVDGSAVFDTAIGVMLECQFLAEGTTTASSISTSSGGQGLYRQATWIRLLGPQDAPATLPVSGIVP